MSKILIHTTEQPDSDITCIILSCNRLDLLDITISSFIKTKDYDTKMLLLDDSGDLGVFDLLVEKYGYFCDIVCFPENRNQWWAVDFMISYCNTEYIFYLEDDWELIKSGYLETSKSILNKYRDIGVIDISFRTFEWQGIDSYEKKLIDDTFFYKKFWRIDDYHYRWYGWIGSPNLKRRDDLILLGRLEKYYEEIWIDRKFLALGFKSIFLKDKYCEHLGDNRSKAAVHRTDLLSTPEDRYPKELLPNRIYPKLDYLQWDYDYRPPTDITLVTAIVDIDRKDRSFEFHYLNSLEKILETRHPIVIYTESKYFDRIKSIRKDNLIVLKDISIDDIKNQYFFSTFKKIINDPIWYSQSNWMIDSVIRNENYIPITLMKQFFLEDSLKYFNSSYFYWIDAGIYHSFSLKDNINDMFFTRVPKNNLFFTTYNYHSESEIHGYNMNKMIERCNQVPTYVCRATFYGGDREYINKINNAYKEEINWALANNCIGTEESIYTILSYRYSELFNLYNMPDGDIKNFFKNLYN